MLCAFSLFVHVQILQQPFGSGLGVWIGSQVSIFNIHITKLARAAVAQVKT